MSFRGCVPTGLRPALLCGVVWVVCFADELFAGCWMWESGVCTQGTGDHSGHVKIGDVGGR